jgi:hypothetical protein
MTAATSANARSAYAHAYELAMRACADRGIADEHRLPVDVSAHGLVMTALAVVTRKALLAIAEADSDTVMGPSGNTRAKTRPRCQVERARVDMLLGVLCDWPKHPYGSTRYAVEERLRWHLYPATPPDAIWTTATHSMSHRVDY